MIVGKKSERLYQLESADTVCIKGHHSLNLRIRYEKEEQGQGTEPRIRTEDCHSHPVPTEAFDINSLIFSTMRILFHAKQRYFPLFRCEELGMTRRVRQKKDKEFPNKPL